MSQAHGGGDDREHVLGGGDVVRVQALLAHGHLGRLRVRVRVKVRVSVRVRVRAKVRVRVRVRGTHTCCRALSALAFFSSLLSEEKSFSKSLLLLAMPVPLPA